MNILRRLLLFAGFITLHSTSGFNLLPRDHLSYRKQNRNDLLCGTLATVTATITSRSTHLKQQTITSSSLQAMDQSMDSVNKPRGDRNIYIIGMLGPCGSGKSYACSLLTSKLNQNIVPDTIIGKDSSVVITAHHIDTDSLAHAVYEPGSKAVAEIGREFGEHVIANGTVDRKALGAIVFRDESMMNKLERIVWPNVKDLVLKRIQDIEESVKEKHGEYQCHTFVIVESAVLLDTNWDEENDLFDAIWLVRASADTRCERLVEKRGMERQDALSRLEAQLRRRGIGNWKEELDRGAITAVIENEGFVGAQLWQEIKKCLTDPDCWKRERNPPLFVVDWTNFL